MGKDKRKKRGFGIPDKIIGAVKKGLRRISPRIHQQLIVDRLSTFHGKLSPEKLLNAIRQADFGQIEYIQDIYQEMEERESQIQANLQIRKLSVAGLNWDVLASTDEKIDLEIAEACKAMLTAIPNFQDHMLHLLGAVSRGFTCEEIQWAISKSNQLIVADLHYVRQQRFTFYESFEPRLRTIKSPILGEELEPGKWIVHIPHSPSGLTNRAGVMRTLSFLYMLKSFNLKFWSIYCEVFGMPIRLGKYDSDEPNNDDIATLKEAVNGLGIDAAAVFPNNMDIEVIATANRQLSPFEVLIKYVDGLITKSVLGHTGSTDSTAGKLGGETNAENVRRDLMEADAKALARTIRWSLLAPFVKFNFGEEAIVPNFWFDYELKPDPKEEADKDKIIIVDIGLPVEKEYLYQKHNIPRPTNKEDILIVSQPQPEFGGQPGGVTAKALFNDILNNMGKKNSMS